MLIRQETPVIILETARPGGLTPFRPFKFLLQLLISGILVSGSSHPVSAQATMIWPELSSLIAPESMISSGSRDAVIPVAGWGNPGSSTMGMMGVSPVVDPAGWMSSGFSGVRFERWNALIYRARRAGNPDDDLTAGYSVIHVSTPLVGEKLFLLVGGTESGSSTNIGFRKEKGQLNRNISENHSWLGLRGRNRKWEYLISLGQKGYFRGAGEAAAAVKMNVRNEMSLSIWGSRRVADDQVEIEYGSDRAEMIVPSSKYMYGIEWTGSVMSWPLGFRLQRKWGSGRGREEPMHRLTPSPDMWLLDLRAGSPDGKFLFSGGLGKGEHRFELLSQGLRYARFLLNDSRFWLRIAGNLNLQGKPLQLWSGYTSTSMRGEGDLEFWPFTPPIIDMLGLRRRAVANLSLNVISAGGRSWLKCSDLCQIYLGIDLHHLWTAGEFESWEPLILGLGRTNILLDRIRLRSAQLLDLGVQGKVSIAGSTSLQGGIAQLLPLEVQKRKPAEGEPVPEPEHREKADVWGGLRWWMSITFDLHH